MSAIGPQFYEFMKKLDENGDKLPTSITSRAFQPEFEFNNSTCYLCNGYYGPSFGEPVCVTCHEFLYPDIPNPNSFLFSEKTDDGDSGNDEPSVGELLYYDRRLTRALQQQGLPNWAFRFQSSLDSEASPEGVVDLSYRPFLSLTINLGPNRDDPNRDGPNNGGPSGMGPCGECGGPIIRPNSAGPNNIAVLDDPNEEDLNGGSPNRPNEEDVSGGPNGEDPSRGPDDVSLSRGSHGVGPHRCLNGGGPSRGPNDGDLSRGPNDGDPNRDLNNGGPSRGPNVGGPSRGPNGGGPSRGPNDGGPSRSPNDGGPSRSPNVGGPSRGPNDGGPSRGPNGGRPNRALNDGGPSRGPYGGGPSRGPNDEGPDGGGPSRGPNDCDPNSRGPSREPNDGDPNGGGPSRRPNDAGSSHDDGMGPAVPDDGQSRPLPSNLARSLAALSTPRLPDNLAPGLVEELPSEVLLCMFSYLDDLSLCACAQVCARWLRLVRARVSQGRWAAFLARRWPLFRPMLMIHDWHKKYQSLVESCFCRNCVVQMCMQSQPPFEENAWRRNRLRNEIKMLRNAPPEGCAATPLDPKCCHWQAMVTGPVGSPYEGGVFFLYIQVPYSYPMSPPVVRFLTRILHPNVSRHGDVGIDSVHHNWSLALTISKLLISIQSLLTDPYTAVCMEPDVGDMYVNERARFERIARRWTWRYAMHDMYCIN